MRSLSQNAGFLNWIVGDTEVIIVLLWYTKNGAVSTGRCNTI